MRQKQWRAPSGWHVIGTRSWGRCAAQKTRLLLLCCATLGSGCASETPLPLVLTQTEVVGCLLPAPALLADCPMPRALVPDPMQGDVAAMLVLQRLALEQCTGDKRALRDYYRDCLLLGRAGEGADAGLAD